jgi:hypothetical protein
VFDDARRRFPTPPMIVLRCAFLARLLLIGWGLFHIRFGKGWRRRLLLLQFLDALVCCGQLLFEDTHSLQGLPQLVF